MTPHTDVRWAARGPATLAGLRAFVVEVARDLDPGSRYVRELLAALDASTSVDDYLARLCDAERAAAFRQDGSQPSRGERGFSWVDGATWAEMDPWERTLSNLLTGETRMMWAGDGADDFARLPEVLAGLPAGGRALSVPCSTGKEPFSIAIAALRGGRADLSITGVDRQAAYVARARSGRLVPHHRDLEVDDAARWFVTDEGGTRARPDVLALCAFEVGDVLTGALPPPASFDLVSCRNLLGYFRGESLDRALTNVLARARPGGVALLDPFVADAREMRQAQERLAAAGLRRRWAGLSFFDVPT
ncbi:MAG: methyltransferase domain-containing protein [Planctomycetes bacterium]|nr:methyltransferase domain-containing protein [Planctomycetota bacterium]